MNPDSPPDGAPAPAKLSKVKRLTELFKNHPLVSLITAFCSFVTAFFALFGLEIEDVRDSIFDFSKSTIEWVACSDHEDNYRSSAAAIKALADGALGRMTRPQYYEQFRSNLEIMEQSGRCVIWVRDADPIFEAAMIYNCVDGGINAIHENSYKKSKDLLLEAIDYGHVGALDFHENTESRERLCELNGY